MRLIAAVCFLCAASLAQSASNSTMRSSPTDADEVRIGKALAAKSVELEGTQPTPQTTKIENYLQSVGDRLAEHAQRKLPYHFHYDPDPGFKSAFALPEEKSSSGPEF